MKNPPLALRITRNFLASLLLIAANIGSAEVDPEELLTQEEAFVAASPALVNGAIKLSWQVAPGYYMYGNQFAATSSQSGVVIGTPTTPMGELKLDELFGEVEVHRDRVDIFVPIQIATTLTEPLLIQTRSQGCADAGVCYPPAKQEWTIERDLTFSKMPESSMPMSGGMAESFGSFGDQPDLLDAADAFRVIPEIIGNNLVVQLQIAEDYYMYRDKIQMNFSSSNVKLAAGSFPAGEWIDDPEFGRVEIFRGGVSAIFPIIAPNGNYELQLNADHQGCADIGICYPPISETFNLVASISGANENLASASESDGSGSVATNSAALAVAGTNATTNNTGVTDNDWFNRTLSQGKLWKVALAMLGFGLVLAFTACMYPMIPILSGIIIGQSSADQAGDNNRPKPKAFTLSVVYVLAVAVTFGVLGLITATIGGGIGIQAYFQSPWLLIPFSILFVLLALSLFGFYDIQVPAGIQNKLQNYSNQQAGGNFVGVAIMGVFSALIIGPCGGPILIAALGYAAASANAISGFVALFFLGLGMGLPLLVIGAGGEKLLPKAGGWMVAVKAFGGVILLAVAILMLERMPSIFAPKLVMLLWSALLIISGVYLFTTRMDNDSGWQKLVRGIGVLVIGYGLLVMLGGMTGGSRVTDPFAGSALTLATPQSQSTQRDFINIKTRADLDEQIAAASANGKTTMLDFYADWCTYCKKFDAYVFPDPRVQSALQNTVLIKADVTATDSEDKALMQSLGVVLPPAILFFDQGGNEITAARVIGELSADEFHEHLISHL